MRHLLVRAGGPALLRSSLLLVPLALTPPAQAQWSSDPSLNLSIADGAGDQVQPKVAPTDDGGCYVSWFDSLANGFDVRLQRLDAGGNELWAHGGVLVADRGFSSTQDYGLDVDDSGAAVLAFRDDSSGSVQIVAQRVDPAGNLTWGSGVQLTSATGFVAAPKVACPFGGESVVAWSEDGVVRLMRLDAAGNDVWAAPEELIPAAGLYFVSDLKDSGGNVILGVVHQTGAQFFSPKHLLAWKFSPGGTSLWGSAPVTVFDGGSLQIGNFPTFVTESSGGAVFGWYGVSPLQCYVQWVLGDGSKAFGATAVAASLDLVNTRVAPSVAFDEATSSTYLFWTEMDSVQSQRGVSGQRFDATGSRQWGPNGRVIVPLGGSDKSFVRTLPHPDGAYVAWLSSPAFGSDLGRAAIVDDSGSALVAPFSFASTPSGKTRLDAALSATGEALLVWGDSRVDAGDVLGQNLRPGGELGVDPFVPFCFGAACPCSNDDLAAGCINSTGQGALLAGAGSASAAADDLTLALGGAPLGQPVLLVVGTAPVNGGAGIFLGDGLRCVGGSVSRLSVLNTGAGGTASFGPGLVGTFGWSAGDTLLFQTWYRDPSASPCGGGFNLSNALGVQLLP